MKAIVALIFLLVIAAPTWATPINVLIMEGEARNFVIGGTLSVVGITGDGRLLTGGGGSNDFFGSNSSFDCSTSGCPRGFPLDLGAIYLPEPAFGTAFMLEGVSNPFPLESARFVAEPARVPDTPGTVSVPFTFEGSARNSHCGRRRPETSGCLWSVPASPRRSLLNTGSSCLRPRRCCPIGSFRDR